jgi:hypothetical protein
VKILLLLAPVIHPYKDDARSVENANQALAIQIVFVPDARKKRCEVSIVSRLCKHTAFFFSYHLHKCVNDVFGNVIYVLHFNGTYLSFEFNRPIDSAFEPDVQIAFC